MKTNELIGPKIYNYFHSMKDHSSDDFALSEYNIYSDSRISGEISVGKNEIFSLHNSLGMLGGNKINPSLLLRIKSHLGPQLTSPIDFSKSDYERYHDGEISDEIAALLSLFLGARLWAGSITRTFDNKHDKYGKALPERNKFSHFFDEINDHHLFHLNKSVQLEKLDMNSFFSLKPEDANALVMAARTYQKSLWVSTYDRNMSWLLLVSAVEIVAKRYFNSASDPVENLKQAKPEWHNRLSTSSNPETLMYMASELSPLIKSTNLFIKFLLTFLPQAPEKRPAKAFCINWEEKYLKKSFRKIYDHRSRALHQGVPFPKFLCETYFHCEIYEEKPTGEAGSANGGIWLNDDMPLHLHIFEYIVRKALLKWVEKIASE